MMIDGSAEVGAPAFVAVDPGRVVAVWAVAGETATMASVAIVRIRARFMSSAFISFGLGAD